MAYRSLYAQSPMGIESLYYLPPTRTLRVGGKSDGCM